MTDREKLEPQVHRCEINLCDLCLDGAGGECHVPGCALFMNRAPDLSLRDGPLVTILYATKVEEKPEVVCTCDEPGNPYPCPRCEP